MLHGFRLILIIGVFLAIAGSVQSGDWRYSVWIVLTLSVALAVSFKVSKDNFLESKEQKDAQNDSCALLFSSTPYFSDKNDHKVRHSSVNSERF
ncbi:hypothetical protein [Pseudoalteromonas phenolica]|uniref:Uncharacterized protein n=1 Tax=Pseudoalteromonas phenolica TaxID=161398 RepID=A0A0S2K2S1_9GAMM|nr:hypothetical protein [Pseudoalteromonas phenolica]ALO42619.1 hypothetical protein PP2015_2121 [Pseudoalteromonas phenolica]MBE0356276.1 hypothetical protein [Pseudoalteromonas phenolica O-BC30]TMO58198.1 hypothetical protein CWC21_00500 [Pseudoalteromonas phenolica]|tara:strand:- start:224 stop:505 length:282 start_codon:yes stop_codon:yes gene_type:complete